MEDNKFKIKNEDGKEVLCEVLFTFESDETNKNYMVYTYNTKDDSGRTRVYASVYNVNDEDGHTELLPVETDREWKIIETIIESVSEEAKKEKGEDEAKV